VRGGSASGDLCWLRQSLPRYRCACSAVRRENHFYGLDGTLVFATNGYVAGLTANDAHPCRTGCTRYVAACCRDLYVLHAVLQACRHASTVPSWLPGASAAERRRESGGHRIVLTGNEAYCVAKNVALALRDLKYLATICGVVAVVRG